MIVKAFLLKLLFYVSGSFWMYFSLKIFSDYFIARNLQIKGQKITAKIIGFYSNQIYGLAEYFDVVEYIDEKEQKKKEVIVARAKKDQIGDYIVVLAASYGYAVRYNWYLPYKMWFRIQEPILCSFVCICAMGFSDSSIAELLVAWIIGVAIFFIVSNKRYKEYCENRAKSSMKIMYADVISIKNYQMPKIIMCQLKDENEHIQLLTKEKRKGRFYEKEGEMVRVVRISGNNELVISVRNTELENSQKRKLTGMFISMFGMITTLLLNVQ